MTQATVTVRITTSSGSSQEYGLSDGDSIGRGPDNAVVLNDDTVSGLHARVRVEGEAVALVDQGSRNGIVLQMGSQERLSAVSLDLGARYYLGNSLLEVLGVRRPDLGDTGVTATGAAPEDLDRTMSDSGVLPSAPAQGAAQAAAEPADLGQTVPDSNILSPPPAAQSPAAPPPAAQPPAPAAEPTPAAAPPAPAPAPAPPPASPAAPTPSGVRMQVSRDHSSVILDSSFGEQTRTEEDGGLAEVAAKAFVDTAAPRLLLFDETGNRVERLRDLPALVGRRSGDIRIERQQVSSKHARIEYSSSTKCCTITDLRSSNKTYLNRDAIPVEVPMSLEPDTFLLFGPAEGVYRAHQRSNGDRVDGAFDEAVAQRLVKAGRLTKGQLSEARSASGPDQPLGDAILLGGHVQPSIWCDAARETAAAPVAAGGSSSTKVILLVVVLAAAAAGVLLATGVI